MEQQPWWPGLWEPPCFVQDNGKCNVSFGPKLAEVVLSMARRGNEMVQMSWEKKQRKSNIRGFEHKTHLIKFLWYYFLFQRLICWPCLTSEFDKCRSWKKFVPSMHPWWREAMTSLGEFCQLVRCEQKKCQILTMSSLSEKNCCERPKPIFGPLFTWYIYIYVFFDIYI